MFSFIDQVRALGISVNGNDTYVCLLSSNKLLNQQKISYCKQKDKNIKINIEDVDFASFIVRAENKETNEKVICSYLPKTLGLCIIKIITNLDQFKTIKVDEFIDKYNVTNLLSIENKKPVVSVKHI